MHSCNEVDNICLVAMLYLLNIVYLLRKVESIQGSSLFYQHGEGKGNYKTI